MEPEYEMLKTVTRDAEISTGDAARALGVTTRTIQNWLISEEIDGYQQINGRWMVYVRSLFALIEKRQVNDGGRTMRRLVTWLEEYTREKTA